MFVPQWLQQLQHCLSPRRSTKGRNSRRHSPAPRRVHLCLEGLEERLTPSVVNPVGNDSPALVGQVNPDAAAATTTTASDATANFSTSDQSVNLTATVTSNGTPVTTGAVTFTVLQGTRVIGTATPGNVNSSGQATASYTLPGGTSAGVYTIAAAYHDSTGSFADSSDNTHTLTVSNSPAAASTTTMASAASATFNTSAQNVTLTATVESNGTAVDTGNVQFTILQGSTVIGTPVTGTVTNGTATVNNYSLPAGTSAGTYTIEADYFDPTGAFDISSDTSHNLTVSAAPTTTTAVNATSGFSTGTQSVTLNATVTSSAGTVDEGKVTFTILQGTTVIGTATSSNVNSSGQASVSYALPAGTAAGSYTIEAAYSDSSGSGNFANSSDTTHTLTVGSASTTTTANSATTAFSSSDQNVTLTANVTSSAGTVNEGSVSFALFDNKGNPIGTATSGPVINGLASVSFVVPGGTAAGSYVINANYSDIGGSFDSSADDTQTLTISTASATTVRLTTVNITPSLSNSTAQVTLTAQVNNAAGAVTDGVVTFTLAGVSGHGNVTNGTASVQLTVPLGAVSNLSTADMSYTDKSASGNFSDVSNSATVTTNLLNALLPANLAFDSSGNVQNQLNVAGNTSLLGFSYLASGLLTDVIFDSVSLPVTYSNVGGNTVTTFLGSPTAVTFVGSNGQVLGKAEVFFDGTQLQWILYDPNNNPIGEVPYASLV